MKSIVSERLSKIFGSPNRETVKVKAWDHLSENVGMVLQKDQPNREDAAYLWLPYPASGQLIPENALEYPGEAGRHSGTHAAAGLKPGEPALRVTIRQPGELEDILLYIQGILAGSTLPQIKRSGESDLRTTSAANADQSLSGIKFSINPSLMPKLEAVKPRREAIPRLIQREVWQRDGGRCVECLKRERLCFDHIVPFSLGGSNSVRNLQLLCESCNLSKSNRI